MKSFFISFFLLGILFYSNAQVNRFEKTNKVLDEFILRFNYNDTTYLNTLLNNRYNEIDRSTFIHYLFDYCNPSLIKDSVLTDKFIQTVCNNGILLDTQDENWYALLKCSFNVKQDNKVKSKTVPLDLVLQYVGSKEKGHKWIIASVGGDLFKMERKSNQIISPVSNDVNFLDLHNLCNSENYMNLVDNGYALDHLSMFLFALRNKIISLESVNSIQYHFMQIDNYIFTVDYFNRSECNQGWLISSLKEVNNEEKINYKNKILYLNEKQPLIKDCSNCEGILSKIKDILK